MRASLILIAFVSVACGGTSPTAPTPVTPSRVTIVGSITAVITGAPVGAFTQEVAALPARVTVSAPGHVTREALVTSVRPTVDLIPETGFDLEFFRKFVRNTYDQPDAMQPLRRQAQAPRIYLKTVDEAGQLIDSVSLDTVASSLANGAEAWTGGWFGLAGIERGTETREGQAGWITVKWLNPAQEGLCGRAQVGGGRIELNYLNRNCGCGASKIRPLTARHELGHAMGFYHTGDRSDLMSGLSVAACDMGPSNRERHHAAIAYARPIGSRDVDVDPTTTGSGQLLAIID